MFLRALLVAVLALPLSLAAQDQKKQDSERAVYRLDYVVAEVEGGKRVETHEYSFQTVESQPSKFRLGMKVPVNVGPNRNVQYMDVGIAIEATTRRDPNDSWLLIKNLYELSAPATAAADAAGIRSAPGEPTIRQLRSETESAVELGKQTQLFSVEKPNSKRTVQVFVTATKIR
jgi:hypothetical protein